jgi:hypothetical protein
VIPIGITGTFAFGKAPTRPLSGAFKSDAKPAAFLKRSVHSSISPLPKLHHVVIESLRQRQNAVYRR